MEVGVGFLIAAAIALTGVGAGTMTAPVLALYLGLPMPTAVGTALSFGAMMKLLATPYLLWRKQIRWELLGLMLLGGLPGVLLGSHLLGRLAHSPWDRATQTAVGAIIAATAASSVLRFFRVGGQSPRGRAGLLPWLSFPIGVEVGFSSAGAGALGNLVLLHFTPARPGEVVATDIVFGLVLGGVAGSLHWTSGHVAPSVLASLALGGVPGLVAGASLASRLPAERLRLALHLWLLVLGSQLMYRGLH